MKTLVRLPEVLGIVSVSRASLYRMIGRGDFPAPIKVGERCVRWHVEDVQNWVTAKRAAAAN